MTTHDHAALSRIVAVLQCEDQDAATRCAVAVAMLQDAIRRRKLEKLAEKLGQNGERAHVSMGEGSTQTRGEVR